MEEVRALVEGMLDDDRAESDIIKAVSPAFRDAPTPDVAAWLYITQIKKNRFPTKDEGFYEGKKADLYGMSRWLRHKYKLTSTSGVDFIYEKTHYIALEDKHLENVIINETKEKATSTDIDKFKKIIRASSYIKDINKVNPGLINMTNGVLELKTGKLLPHNHEYFFKYCLPHQYDQGAECPNIQSFLNKIFEGDQELIDLVFEYFGYTLYGGIPWTHKCLCLHGGGGNGKGILLELFRRLIGPMNYSSVPLDLLSRPFSAVQVYGKLANIVGELTKDMIESDVFKSFTSYEDIVASYKGKDEFTFKPSARLIFACNDLPVLGDSSRGAMRRFVFIPFNYDFEPGEVTRPYVEALHNEIPGFLNMCIVGLHRLLERGEFKIPKASEMTMEDFNVLSDSVLAFMNEKIIMDNKQTTGVSAVECYKTYTDYCSESGLKPFNKNRFQTKLGIHYKKQCKAKGWSYDTKYRMHNVNLYRYMRLVDNMPRNRPNYYDALT